MFRKAILIIHGFAGGTYDQEDLANYLELNRSFDVYQFTLPGHDKSLSKVKYDEWILKSEKIIEMLIDNGYKTIYLIGHSMGGVIATYLSTKYRQVKKLVLLAPAFHYFNVVKEDIDLKSGLKTLPKILEEYGGIEIISKSLKLNVSAVKELMSLVKQYYDVPKDVICPVLILQGEEDLIVPKTSSEYVYNQLSNNVKKLIYIKGVNHEICISERQTEIFEIIEKFLKYNIEGGIDKI